MQSYVYHAHATEKLKRLTCGALMAGSNIFESCETMQVQSEPGWEPHFAWNYNFVSSDMYLFCYNYFFQVERIIL